MLDTPMAIPATRQAINRVCVSLAATEIARLALTEVNASARGITTKAVMIDAMEELFGSLPMYMSMIS
jgi:hypothetical protein